VARALPSGFAAVAGATALASVLLFRHSPANALLVAGVFLAAGTAPLLDDEAATIVASSPTPLWVRRGTRLAVALPTFAIVWLMLLSVAALLAPAGADVPFILVTWHWVGMLAVVLTVSCVATAVAVPAFDGSAGVAGLLGILAADVVVQRLWPRFGVFLLADPDVSTRLQVRMGGLVAVSALALAISGRDPSRRWSRTCSRDLRRSPSSRGGPRIDASRCPTDPKITGPVG